MLKRVSIMLISICLTGLYGQNSNVSSDEAQLVPEKNLVKETRVAPKLLTYQGYISDTAGIPINDSLNMTFKIFDAATSGNELWSETQNNVPIIRGVFNVLLGSSTSIPDTVFTKGTDRWLELILEGPQTLSPRTRIAAAGYAYTATYSDTAEYAKTAMPDTDWVIFTDTMYSGISGNVGIGTASPSEKLEVEGNVKVCGSGNGLIFPDDTKQTTAIIGGGVPSGYCVLGETQTAPPGYTYTGIYFSGNASDTLKWTIKTAMPTARYRLAVVAVNGKIYAIGGYNGSVLSTNEEYDPVSNSWTTKASMPTPRYALAAAAANGKIYAIGGYDGSYFNTNEEYDPVTNSWILKMGMPYNNASLAATELNGKIYAVGGEGHLTGNFEYDPIGNSWTIKQSMFWSRYGLAAAAVNGKIYAIGGWFSSSFVSYNEEFDPIGNSWTTKTNMPTARAWLAAAALNGKIYAIGGNFYGVLNKNEEYDPVGNSWSTKVTMPTAREALGGAEVNGKVYAIGGYNGSYMDNNEEYGPGTATPTLYVHRKN